MEHAVQLGQVHRGHSPDSAAVLAVIWVGAGATRRVGNAFYVEFKVLNTQKFSSFLKKKRWKNSAKVERHTG